MSFDLYFWPAGATRNARRLAARLAAERADELVPDERVLAFRAELLHRWPEIADMIAPWHHDLGGRQPWGRTGLADRFVVLTLPYRWEPIAALPALAGSHGLACYDPQAGQLVTARPWRENGEIRGRVPHDRLADLMRRISGYIGYPYDDLDASALVGALDGGDWFEYPLLGSPALTVRAALDPSGTGVDVRIDGAADPVLIARIDALLAGL